MGQLLEFKPRVPPPEGDPVVLTPQEKREKLRTRTLDDVRNLVVYYRSTDCWTDACEAHVITALEQLELVCEILSGGQHEQPAPRIG